MSVEVSKTSKLFGVLAARHKMHLKF